MKVINKNRFGEEITLDQMIRMWKKGIEKDELVYQLKRHEHHLSNREARLLQQARLRKLDKSKRRKK